MVFYAYSIMYNKDNIILTEEKSKPKIKSVTA